MPQGIGFASRLIGGKSRYAWRRSAGCARVFIEISNVFESEAVPGEQLIACLDAASDESWDYCYVRKAPS